MNFKEFIKPTKSKVFILFIISLSLIIASYLLFHVFTIGQTDCGSKCLRWLNPIDPFAQFTICEAICWPLFGVQNIPNPLYAPLLQIGTIFLLVSIAYLIYFLKKFIK